MDPADEDRFAALVSRSLKWRLWILTIALAAVLGVSSAVNAGLVASRTLDDAFLAKQLDDLAALTPTLDLKPLRDAADDSATFLALIRRLLEAGQSLFAVPGDEETANLRRAIDTRLEQFATHDRERNDAFLIRLSLPYLSEPASVNARLIAALWPPCLVIILVVVTGFGYQQRAFEIILSDTIGRSATERERARREALAEFIPGRLVPVKAGQREVWLYRRPFTIRPRAAMIAGLATLVIVLSLSLMLTGDPAISRPPRSIVNLHHSSGVLLVLAALIVVVQSRAFYYRKAGAIIGRNVRGYWAFHVERFWRDGLHWLDRDLG